jgi:hypothetical protein
VTLANLAEPGEAPKAAVKAPKSSGVKVIAIRVADFRSLTNIEVALDDLTVLKPRRLATETPQG